jgi:hypothetical protein
MSKKEEILNAEVIDNKIYCSKCKKRDYRISDYNIVEHKGQKYTRFTMRCVCGTLNRFCSLITMDNEVHCIIDDADLSEVKEEGEYSNVEDDN